MVVITLTNCPPTVKGDLSKWMFEIHTGTFCGQINARVRESIWKRICQHLETGSATMIYTTNNEQHFDFKVYNCKWEIIDLDGVKLMSHPSKKKIENNDCDVVKDLSSSLDIRNYCIVDIETTGLDAQKDEIIEIGILRVRNDEIVDQFNSLVKTSDKIPTYIKKITGLSDNKIAAEGIDPYEAVKGVLNFINQDIIVGYNVSFDCDFLYAAIRKYGIKNDISFNSIDVYSIVRKMISGISNYKLSTVSEFLKVDKKPMHRSINDCLITYDVLLKLKEIGSKK